VPAVRIGSVGRAHGLDGAFYLERPATELSAGMTVRLAGREVDVDKVAGTSARPIVHLEGIETRAAAEALYCEPLYVEQARDDLDRGEYFATDLVGLQIAGLGEVRRVINGPSCDLLEVGDAGTLVPFIRDAIRHVDTAAGTIEVDVGFLGLR